MKLVIDDVSSLDTIDARTRPVVGYKAAVMAYDFEVSSGDAKAFGSAGDVLVIAPDGALSVMSADDFAAGYQRTVERKAGAAKPGRKPKAAKADAA